MYVCIVASAFPTVKYPLSGIFELDQAKALKTAGCKVVLLTVDLRSIRRLRRWGIYHTIREGIDIYNISLPLGRVSGKIFHEVGKRALFSLFKKVVKEQGMPDIVHAHFTGMGAITSVLKIKYRLPFVVTEHGSNMNRDIIGLKDIFLGNLAYNNVDQLISVSSSLQKHIGKNFGVKSVVIPNIVDVTNIMRSPVPHEIFTFISIGNLIEGKGFDLLIKAFKIFKDRPIRLLIIGEGEQRAFLNTLIADLGLEKQVVLLGLKSRQEISAYLNGSDVFILASRGETFGVVYIEALLAGLPVIATKCGGPEDFVNDTNGLLIECEDVKGLEDALLRMYEKIDDYDGNKISSDCLQRFSPHAVASALMTVYRQILNANEGN
ncbi:MAG: glycosyltransferase [Odoribacter splanchnicus]